MKMMMIGRHTVVALGLSAAFLTGCSGSDDTPSASVTKAPAAPASDPALSAKDLGQVAYAEHCVMCHGVTGAGDGTMVGALPTKPRRFDAEAWRFVDFSAGDEAVRAEIARVLREGIGDVMMPGYADKLSAAEIDAVVDHVLVLRGG